MVAGPQVEQFRRPKSPKFRSAVPPFAQLDDACAKDVAWTTYRSGTDAGTFVPGRAIDLVKAGCGMSTADTPTGTRTRDAEDLTKVYAGTDFAAVDRLNLGVKAGEIFGLLGSNGTSSLPG